MEIADIDISKKMIREIEQLELKNFSPIIENKNEFEQITEYDELEDILATDCFYDAIEVINFYMREG